MRCMVTHFIGFDGDCSKYLNEILQFFVENISKACCDSFILIHDIKVIQFILGCGIFCCFLGFDYIILAWEKSSK